MVAAYDVIVIGVGGFGSGTLFHLARRGARVLGLEQFDVGHARGSSHGESRIIRKAYFEHPDYVPLLTRAYQLWNELEQESGRPLFHPVGLFIAGCPDCESVAGTLEAARHHHLPVETLTPAEAAQRFPGFRFAEEFSVVFERDAGFLEVERCVRAHADLACRHGAQLHTGETVRHWSADAHQVRVQTDRGEYVAQKLVITAGPWASAVLHSAANGASDAQVDWSQKLRVLRKPVFWFAADERFDVSRNQPTFFFETGAGQFYGIPRWDGRSIKVAEHTSGDAVADPSHVDRTEHAADLHRIAAFMRSHIPAIEPVPCGHSVCLYTKSPDGHFLIDRHPQLANVVLAAGFSGHGFKFTSVLGEALAELTLEGRTGLPIEFLSLARFGSREGLEI